MNSRGSSTSDSARERVYLDFYNLDEAPFSIAPDPEYFFYSVTHQNAIDKLLYGTNSRMGFLLLVGEVGTGKTTICRSLLDYLENKASTVYIINPSLSGTELISSILDDLGIDYPKDASKKELINALNWICFETTCFLDYRNRLLFLIHHSFSQTLNMAINIITYHVILYHLASEFASI